MGQLLRVVNIALVREKPYKLAFVMKEKRLPNSLVTVDDGFGPAA